MWFLKRKRFLHPACSSHRVLRLNKVSGKKKYCMILSLCLIFFLGTGCEKQQRKEMSSKDVKKEMQDQWKPLEISPDEKENARKQTDHIEEIYQEMIPNREEKPLKKEQEQLTNALEQQNYAVADVDGVLAEKSAGKAQDFDHLWEHGQTGELQMIKFNPSGGFSLMTLSKTKNGGQGILTTLIPTDQGRFSVSEMVKYKIKKVWIEKKSFCFEFYLSDQAELQTDGTMKFYLSGE